MVKNSPAKPRCGFAVVLLKRSGERKVWRCIDHPSEIYEDGNHYDGHDIAYHSHYQESAGISVSGPYEPPVGVGDVTSPRMCAAGIMIETPDRIHQISCQQPFDHEGFHTANGVPRRMRGWYGAIWVVYRDYPNRMLASKQGINDPLQQLVGWRYELPKYKRPKKPLPPPPPTREEILAETRDRVRRRSRALIEAINELARLLADPVAKPELVY